MTPDVQYARAEDGVHIAYQVLEPDLGVHADHDIVMVSGGMFPIESFDGYRGFTRLLEGLRAIGRVVIFDRRGIGLSDPPNHFDTPILDQWAEDLHAVVEASCGENVVIFSWDGFGVASRYAARHPDRVASLVLHHPMAGGEPDGGWGRRADLIRRNLEGDGGDELIALIAPTAHSDPSFREWYLRAGRLGASPASASRIWESVLSSDPDEQLLEEVDVPTLVLCRADHEYASPEGVRAAAARLRRVTVVDVPGVDLFPFLDDVDAIVAEVSQFVLGERRTPPPQRILAAVLLTDLVDSTARAAAMGDARWKAVLDRHDAVIRVSVAHHGGTVVKGTGDGVLALLPSATAALEVACRIHRDLAQQSLLARIGVHVGDVDRRGDDISGLAAHIAARVMSKAGAGEILVTDSVVAAMGGPAPSFQKRGEHELKGVPGVWMLSCYDPEC